MLKKHQKIGKTLNRDEMKMIKGGDIWPYFVTYECTNPFGGSNLPGGCTDRVAYAAGCCSIYGGTSTPTAWGAPNSCPALDCVFA